MIVANQATDTFNQDVASVTVYWPDHDKALAGLRKSQLARELIELIAQCYRAQARP